MLSLVSHGFVALISRLLCAHLVFIEFPPNLAMQIDPYHVFFHHFKIIKELKMKKLRRHSERRGSFRVSLCFYYSFPMSVHCLVHALRNNQIRWSTLGIHVLFQIALCVCRLKLEAITHLRNLYVLQTHYFSLFTFGKVVQRCVACSDFLSVNLTDLDEWIQYDSQKPLRLHQDCSSQAVWQGNASSLRQGPAAASISPFPVGVF